MKELSLNILDIAENSVKAGAKHVGIELEQKGSALTLTITDDGCGMDGQTLARVADPFYTTRTTRAVGMGISLLKLAAEQTGGELTISSKTQEASPDDHGTVLRASFDASHIDCAPLGDIAATLVTLIQGHAQIDFHFSHRTDSGTVKLDTTEIRAILGEEVPLDSFEVLQWILGYLQEQYEEIHTP